MNLTTQPQHFESSIIPRLGHKLSRAPVDEQLKKICFSCEKGFCKRKGRGKFSIVSNHPGRYVCEKCTRDFINGKPNSKIYEPLADALTTDT